MRAVLGTNWARRKSLFDLALNRMETPCLQTEEAGLADVGAAHSIANGSAPGRSISRSSCCALQAKRGVKVFTHYGVLKLGSLT